MSKNNPHSTAREDGSCDDCGSFHGMIVTRAPRPKPVHRAKLMSPDGHVSPLCAKSPRAINLKVASWTIVGRQVTCPKCLKLMSIPRSPGAGKAS